MSARRGSVKRSPAAAAAPLCRVQTAVLINTVPRMWTAKRARVGVKTEQGGLPDRNTLWGRARSVVQQALVHTTNLQDREVKLES